MKMEAKTRRNILLAISGLIVANVRSLVQNNEFAISSVAVFFGAWIVHYFAVLLVGMAAYVIYSTKRSKYFDDYKDEKPIEPEEFIYIVSIVAIVASLFILFLYFYVPQDTDGW